MRVAVISANLGAYDPQVEWVDQVVPDDVTVDIHRFTDANFPPRPLAMTSRLQAGIPKMFGWQLCPGYDVYLWIDASRGLLRPDTVAWFPDQAGPAELLLFRHPERSTVRDEYAFVKAKLAKGSRYLTSRYQGEWLDEQYRAVCELGWPDTTLYASTAFLYRPTPAVRWLLTQWWHHKTRYLLHDQLALPVLVRTSGVSVHVLDDDVYHCVHLPITRK